MAERTEHLEAVLLSAVRPSQEQEKRFLAFLAGKRVMTTPAVSASRWARKSTTGARADA